MPGPPRWIGPPTGIFASLSPVRSTRSLPRRPTANRDLGQIRRWMIVPATPLRTNAGDILFERQDLIEHRRSDHAAPRGDVSRIDQKCDLDQIYTVRCGWRSRLPGDNSGTSEKGLNKPPAWTSSNRRLFGSLQIVVSWGNARSGSMRDDLGFAEHPAAGARGEYRAVPPTSGNVPDRERTPVRTA